MTICDEDDNDDWLMMMWVRIAMTDYDDDNDDVDFDGNNNDDQWSGPSVLYFNLLAANSPECTFDTSSYKINDDDDVWGQIVPQGGNFDAFSLPLLAV